MEKTYSAYVCRTCATKLGWVDLKYVDKAGQCHWCKSIAKVMADSPRLDRYESNKRKSSRKAK